MQLVQAASSINPKLGMAVGALVALFGPAITRRFGRVEDVLETIRDNPSIFTAPLLEDEEFQDGLIFFVEKYIRERNEDKLVLMRNIFVGFSQFQDRTEFPLEEMMDLVSKLRFTDIRILRSTVDQARQIRENTSFQSLEDPFRVGRLVYFGLLVEDRPRNVPGIREADDPGYLYVKVSPLGKQFSEYLSESK